MCGLRFFEIHIGVSCSTVYKLETLMDSLCICLSPATLEHLELNICFHYFTNRVDNPYYVDLRDTWRRLDSIITRSTGSRLQRVDVNISCSFRYSLYQIDEELDKFDEDEVWKVVLDGLPLLRTKGILFIKVALVQQWP